MPDSFYCFEDKVDIATDVNYYPCWAMGFLWRCFSSVGAAFLTNLKVVIYKAIYWGMAKISKEEHVKKGGSGASAHYELL